MRLTLRTLLAYIDNILEPEDRELLEKKVQESEFAQNLIKRSRGTVNDQELSAMDPIGHGLRQDPNLVAEYLDNTMAREQIEEFERQCLDISSEADSHLAEITACHHILTMVLGEPLQFTASSRERMYQIGDDGSTSGPVGGEADARQADEIDSHMERRARMSEDANLGLNTVSGGTDPVIDSGEPIYSSKIPDYLREEDKRSRWLPVVATTLVAAVVTGLLLILFGSDSSERAQSETIAQADPQSTTPDETIVNETSPPGANPPGALEDLSPETTVETVPEIPKEANDEVELQKQDSKNDLTNQPSGPADALPGAPTESPPANQPTEEKNSLPKSPAPAKEDSPSTETGSSEIGQPAKSDKDTATAAPPIEEPPVGSQVLGRLLSNDQILLASPKGFDELRWLPPQANLKRGHKLLALPTFRPNLSLVALTVELEGGSLLELIDLSAGGVPTVQLFYGRMVVRTNINGGSFRLKLSDTRTITLTLRNTDAAIGIEVWPQTRAGENPEKTAQRLKIALYAKSGSTMWQEKALQGMVEAGQQQNLTQLPPPEPKSFSTPPEWLTKAQMTKLEFRAIPALRDVVQADRSVKLSLSELVEKRRQVEVKELALRCCAYIGYYDPLIKVLGDETKDRRWGKCATYLQTAVGLHPDYAKRVRESMEGLHNEKGFDLYRMLWGYTNEGLINNGEAEELVNFLSHEDLEYRVLSHWNLKDITDKSLNFSPNKTEKQRRQSLKRWESLLDKGEIKHPAEKN